VYITRDRVINTIENTLFFGMSFRGERKECDLVCLSWWWTQWFRGTFHQLHVFKTNIKTSFNHLASFIKKRKNIFLLFCIHRKKNVTWRSQFHMGLVFYYDDKTGLTENRGKLFFPNWLFFCFQTTWLKLFK